MGEFNSQGTKLRLKGGKGKAGVYVYDYYKGTQDQIKVRIWKGK